MNPLEEMKKDVLQRVLTAKRNVKISDTQLIALLNERINKNETPFHRNTVNDWKNSKSSSFLDHLDDIAEFTRTSTDYLIGRKNSENSLDNPAPHVYDVYDEQLLNLFRALNEEGKRTAIGLVESLTEQGHFKKPLQDELENPQAIKY
jgi:hypothetical protein